MGDRDREQGQNMEITETVFLDIALVVVASAVLAWLSSRVRQPIIVAYMVAGAVLGPGGLKFVSEIGFLNEVSHIGVTLLLFLAGLTLHPHRLVALFKKTVLPTLATALIFAAVAAGCSAAWGYPPLESLIIGLALSFSSTIIVIKLVPTTTLHQQHMGSVCIAVLIIQDILAVTALLILGSDPPTSWGGWAVIPLKGVGMFAGVLLVERFILRRIMRQVEHYHELLYLMTIAWCFAVALLAEVAGMSHEIGAFLAGVALANGPIALFLSEGLKFFRDFFLVLFFFTLGARLDFKVLHEIVLPASILAALLIVLKPAVYLWFFKRAGETGRFSRELGVRMGQASEFSLIIALAAAAGGTISLRASQLIQVTTILTMIASSYAVVSFYPTPLGTRTSLKQD